MERSVYLRAESTEEEAQCLKAELEKLNIKATILTIDWSVAPQKTKRVQEQLKQGQEQAEEQQESTSTNYEETSSNTTFAAESSTLSQKKTLFASF